MKTDTSDTSPAETDATLPTNAIFELLLEDRRRYALYYLSRKVGAVSIEELVDGIAEREGEPTRERTAQIAVEFHHNHLRRLVDSNVVRHDADAETVERRRAARSLDPYFDLAYVDDL